MRVVGHAIDCNQFLALPRDDSRNVFLQLLAVRRSDDAGAAGNSEDNVEIYLRVGVSHSRAASHDAPNGAYRTPCCGGYKHGAPPALAARGVFNVFAGIKLRQERNVYGLIARAQAKLHGSGIFLKYLFTRLLPEPLPGAQSESGTGCSLHSPSRAGHRI